MFQSLSRDSGRLNRWIGHLPSRPRSRVSIPQSGFGAFEQGIYEMLDWPPVWFQSLSRDSGRLNIAVVAAQLQASEFQSLSRDSGRLNWSSSDDRSGLDAVSIPQSGFGAFEQLDARSAAERIAGFNPSVGIRGV